MTPLCTLRRALADPKLLGSVLSGDSWAAWRTLLIAAMGEELRDDERVIFKRLTGREREPGERVSELTAVVGRRGGKSRARCRCWPPTSPRCASTPSLPASAAWC
jgi:hypothetical protein